MIKLMVLLSLCIWLTASACTAGRTGTPRDVRTAQNQQVYELYRQYMEALNRERQQTGLPPLTVRSYEDFRRSPGTD